MRLSQKRQKLLLVDTGILAVCVNTRQRVFELVRKHLPHTGIVCLHSPCSAEVAEHLHALHCGFSLEIETGFDYILSLAGNVTGYPKAKRIIYAATTSRVRK